MQNYIFVPQLYDETMDRLDVLESDALRSFGVFAEHRNFTTAAAALSISQPSLHVKMRSSG